MDDQPLYWDPKMGSPEKPVVVYAYTELTTRHNHAHLPDGRCLKNRWSIDGLCQVNDPPIDAGRAALEAWLDA
jgi:hypothetical protein